LSANRLLDCAALMDGFVAAFASKLVVVRGLEATTHRDNAALRAAALAAGELARLRVDGTLLSVDEVLAIALDTPARGRPASAVRPIGRSADA